MAAPLLLLPLLGTVAAPRTLLEQPLDLYVAAAGSDGPGNNCTSPTAPCATPTAAYQFVQRHIDIGGLSVTVHLLSNITVAAGWSFEGPLVGGAGPGSFVIDGGSTSSGTTTGRTEGAAAALPVRTVRLVESSAAGTVGLFFANDGAAFTLANMQLASPLANGYTVLVADGAVHVSGLTFLENRCSLDVCGGRSVIAQTGPLTWHAANFTFGAVAEDHGVIDLSGPLIMEGSPVFGSQREGAFVQADLGGMVDGSGAVVSGGARGRRYVASTNGIVFTGGTGNASFFPGDVAGTVGGGGIYQ